MTPQFATSNDNANSKGYLLIPVKSNDPVGKSLVRLLPPFASAPYELVPEANRKKKDRHYKFEMSNTAAKLTALKFIHPPY